MLLNDVRYHLLWKCPHYLQTLPKPTLMEIQDNKNSKGLSQTSRPSSSPPSSSWPPSTSYKNSDKILQSLSYTMFEDIMFTPTNFFVHIVCGREDFLSAFSSFDTSKGSIVPGRLLNLLLNSGTSSFSNPSFTRPYKIMGFRSS